MGVDKDTAGYKPLNSDQWHQVIVGNTDAREEAAKIVSGCVKLWYKPVEEHTFPDQTVLEIGSGTGLLSGALAKNKRKVALLDLSSENLEFSKTVFKYAKLDGKFIQGDVLKLFPFCDNTFDCVWSHGLLEHFTDDEIDFIMSESARVSKSVVLTMVPNAASIPYRIGKWYQQLKGSWPYGRENPEYTLRGYFEKAGLRSIVEYSIDPRHSFEFLAMLSGNAIGKVILRLLYRIPLKALKALNQGWLLVTVGKKPVKNSLGDTKNDL